MTKDEQARARLVEIAHRTVAEQARCSHGNPFEVRTRAGFKNPSKGHWCAAGLTWAMETAGLVVPAPGTPARRGAVALLDFVARHCDGYGYAGDPLLALNAVAGMPAQPGDLIAWLQHPPGKDPDGWRRGHVALIVAVNDDSITTVGWNEGNAPGKVMKRRLWRDPERREQYKGDGEWRGSTFTRRVPRSSTVAYRRPGGLYGIARPVAR